MGFEEQFIRREKIQKNIIKALFKNKNKILIAGILFLATGIIACVFPILSSLSISIFAGALLTLYGVTSLFNAFSFEGTHPFFGAFMFGLISTAAGIVLISNPTIGMMTLTLAIAIVFLMDGIYQIYTGVQIRPQKGSTLLMISGAISTLCGIVIAFGLPTVSLFLIGIILGINFITTGLALIYMRYKLPKIAEEVSKLQITEKAG